MAARSIGPTGPPTSTLPARPPTPEVRPRFIAHHPNFQKQTGITVDYQEKIDDNAHFFATIQPQLVAGLSTGWDLIVMTDWMAAKLIAKGWIEKIDQGAVPNCVANLRDPLKGLSWDPDNDFHYPWQSGMTGIGYDSRR